MDVNTMQQAEQFFHERIPLTRTMGVRVVSYDERGLTLEAPVALNYNHLQTAFGGSINAIATLAGYGLLWLELRDTATHVVVAESTIRFLRPIRQTIRATCASPPRHELDSLRETLRAKGKARIKLAVVVEENGAPAAQFNGTFVAVTDRAPAL
jgi:thioesterase domain-containing protein